jgi:hypothetical protein
MIFTSLDGRYNGRIIPNYQEICREDEIKLKEDKNVSR